MIDIIIPVYNTPINDLKRCLNSIYLQEYKDYKAYIIDDGSKDEVKLFLDKYIKDKPNFYLKHIQNSGISNARNVGLELSNSKYIAFVDSDDTIEKNFLKEAIKLIKENDLDLVIGGYNQIKDNKIIKTRKSSNGLFIYTKNNIPPIFDKLLSTKLKETNKEVLSSPLGRVYTKLFKRESIKDKYFNTNVKMSEDTLFLIDVLPTLNRVGLIDKVWYNYYDNSYSTVNDKDYKKKLKNIYSFVEEVYKRLILEKNKTIKNAYYMRLFKISIIINNICIRNKDLNLKEEYLNDKIFRETFSKVNLDEYIDITEEEKIFLEENKNRR